MVSMVTSAESLSTRVMSMFANKVVPSRMSKWAVSEAEGWLTAVPHSGCRRRNLRDIFQNLEHASVVGQVFADHGKLCLGIPPLWRWPARV